jgi:hypothetical protein
LVSPYQALELSSATRKLFMIDDPCKTEQLMSSLEAALPLESRIGPQFAAVLQNKIPNLKPLQRCQISQVLYTGDEGGIVCGLDLPAAAGKEVYLASITHLVKPLHESAMRRKHLLAQRFGVEAQNKISLVEGHDAGRLGSARSTPAAAPSPG